MNNNNDNDIKRLLTERRRKKFLERINREREAIFQKLKNEIFENNLSSFSREEKQLRKEELLKFVHRYMFINKIKPLSDNNLNNKFQSKRLQYIKEQDFIKRIFQIIILIRSFMDKLPGIRSFVFLLSLFLFFMIEYWLHYNTSFSLKNINITYQDIIDKIPPFF